MARLGEEGGLYTFLVVNRREGDYWGDLGLDGWIILGWISRWCVVGVWTGLGWLRMRMFGGGLYMR